MKKLTKILIAFTFFMPVFVVAELDYPYVVNTEREELIKTQYINVSIGDSIEEVLEKLSNPDEIRDLYEPKVFQPKVIGITYWYIIQRMVESGSVNEKDEKLVRVSFDLKGKVTKIDHWGF